MKRLKKDAFMPFFFTPSLCWHSQSLSVWSKFVFFKLYILTATLVSFLILPFLGGGVGRGVFCLSLNHFFFFFESLWIRGIDSGFNHLLATIKAHKYRCNQKDISRWLTRQGRRRHCTFWVQLLAWLSHCRMRNWLECFDPVSKWPWHLCNLIRHEKLQSENCR